jgi:hypothetical protein
MPKEETGMANAANDDKLISNQHKNRWIFIASGLAIVVIITLIIAFATQPGRNKPGETTTHPGSTSGNLTIDALSAMVGYDLLPTQPDGSVQRERIISRAEFAGLISKVLQVDANVTSQPSYSDVLPSHPLYSAIEGVKDYFGYQRPAETTGPSATSQGQHPDLPKFNPDNPVKRSEAIMILCAALKFDSAVNILADSIKLPADDPILTDIDQNLLAQDAARLFYLLIASRLPTPAPTFSVDAVQ